MFPESPPFHGSIEVICGSMYSGKTEELIRRIRRVQFAKLHVKCFKPKTDSRYHEENVVSHNSNSIHSTVVEHSSEILDLAPGLHVVAIDEAQFFDQNLPNVCNTLANWGIRVIVAGLDMDFQGNPFGPMPHLLAIAEHVQKVHAICERTGDLAHYSFRTTPNEELIALGEKESYIPLSRKAFIELSTKSQNK